MTARKTSKKKGQTEKPKRPARTRAEAPAAAEAATPDAAPMPPPADLTAEAPAPAPAPKRGLAKAPKAEAGRLSALDAAARVLAESGEPMNSQELIGAMACKGYWTSPNGKTPGATLYSAMTREINLKAGDSRFRKVGRGRFASNA
jgi:hypothetical protein